MAHYMLAIVQPDGPAPDESFLGPIMQAVGQVNQEMVTAGVWVWAMGLVDATTAKVLKLADGPGSKVISTDGPYAEGKEHLGGFTIIDVEDETAALHWGSKLAAAITLPIEVRTAKFSQGLG